MLDLIPIKQVKTRLSLSPNEARYRATTASITPPKNQALERPGTQLRMRTPIVYHRSNKPRNLRKRRASTMSTEDHENSETVESLLEKTSENLTDD